MATNIDQTKQAVRERIWALLDERHAVDPPGAAGHIPAFVGADAAARRLAQLPAWQAARVVKANPDRAQLPVRVQALLDGKLLYMAVPKLASEPPFYRLDPAEIDERYEDVATGLGAARAVERVGVDAMQPVDLVVAGSVAVDRQGTRIGKGAGYSDIEVALLIEAGLLSADTTIVSTVHELQIVNEPLPATEHDFGLDLIATPDRILECPRTTRPNGLLWEHLSRDKIAAIPALTRTRHDDQADHGHAY